MSKFKVFFLLFIILFTLIQCKNVNYLNYYSKINEAELYINKQKFDSAIIVYETLLKKYSNSFYKDLHNACICCLKENNLNKAERLAEQLVKHGYEIEDFEKDSTFKSLINSSQWKTFNSNYRALRENYLATLNLDERNNFQKIFVKDQKAASSGRMSFQDSTFYFQAIELERLFLKNGFPDCMMNKDTMNAKIQIMIRHYFGLVNRIKSNPEMIKEGVYRLMDFNKSNLMKIVEDGLYKGLILPESFVSMTSYWDYSNPFGKIFIKVDFDKERVTLFLDLPSEKLNEVNVNRKLIGLPEVNYTNSDILNNTWYSKYPFKEIKNAISACDTCNTKSKYVDVIVNEELKVSDGFINSALKGFILTDNSKANTFYEGVNKLFKNAKSI